MNTAEVPHVVCTHCSTTNRVPAERLHHDPVCGRCGKGLLTGDAIEVNEAQFEAIISKTDLPVLVDFWAPWCGPCRMMAPAFAQAAAQLKGHALLLKVNSDEAPTLSSRFGIRSIPTLVRLAHGREVSRSSGALPAAQIVAMGR